MNVKSFALLLVAFALSASGFSPYENHLLSSRQTHVALIASVRNPDGMADAIQSLRIKSSIKAFRKGAISNVSVFTKVLQEKTWVMVYFDYEGENYLEAVNAFESIGAVKKMDALLEAHPRAKMQGTTWLQMEWINYIHGSRSTGAAQSHTAMVTRIKPEREQEYRLLHQTVWPGVVDQMARGNHRNFSIFFVEIGDELYEFFYVEYIGTDPVKDGASDRADPFNKRWWRLTDPCQDPLPDANGIWSPMDEMVETGIKK